MKAKSIKGTTAARYSTLQIYKHLDRIQSQLDIDKYYIDFQVGKVYVWHTREQRRQLYTCMNRYDYIPALGAVLDLYREHDIDHDWFDRDGFLEKKGWTI